MGDDELWDRVHGQGRCGSVCGARRGVAVSENGIVVEGVLGHDHMRSAGGVHGVAVAETSGGEGGPEIGADCRGYGGDRDTSKRRRIAKTVRAKVRPHLTR